MFSVVEGEVKNIKLENASILGKNNVGGIAGSVDEQATVSGSVSGSVTGINHVGGLAGINAGNVAGYTTGNVLGESFIGGLVGYIHNIRTTTIGYLTSTGKVTGDGESVGGLIVGFYSRKTGESVANYPISSGGLNGFSGTSITIDQTTTADDFTGFVFGTEVGNWTFITRKWPKINLRNDSIFSGLQQPIDP